MKQLTEEEIFRAIRELDTYLRNNQLTNQNSLYTNNGVRQWIEYNILLSLAYGTYLPSTSLQVSYNPGTTGVIMECSELYQSFTQLETSSLADSVEIVVYNTGQIEIKAIKQNYMHDRQTVLKIRELMQSGQCATVSEAQQLLRKSGHYDTSYQQKRLNPITGNVAVCDGSEDFTERVFGGDPTSSGSRYKLAKFLVSDGVLAPFLPFIGNNDTQGITELITMLLRNDPGTMAYIQSREADSFMDVENLPTREKLSDDKSIVAVLFNDSDTIERVIKEGLFVVG